MRLCDHIHPFTFTQKARALHSLYSAEELRKILERERARTDRNGCEFSLIVFEIDKTEKGNISAKELVQVLNRRVRSIDEVGWLDGRRIGAVLTDTPSKGARKLAEDICQAVGTSGPRPSCMVFTYPTQWLQRYNGARPQPQKTRISRNTKPEKNKNSTIPTYGPEPLLPNRVPVWKRIIDFFGALGALIILFPVFLLIGVFIKIVSPGPIFFIQERVGYLGKPFNCWKFRTMHVNSVTSEHKHYVTELMKSNNPLKKLDDDDHRIFLFGKILRKSYLDELPQLFNVLRGEMSLVGPRPDVPYSVQNYTQWYNRRFDAVPGMTGLWQVSGKDRTTFKEMVRLDIIYTQKKSLWLDLKILLKTLPFIFVQTFHFSFKKEDKNLSIK